VAVVVTSAFGRRRAKGESRMERVRASPVRVARTMVVVVRLARQVRGRSLAMSKNAMPFIMTLVAAPTRVPMGGLTIVQNVVELTRWLLAVNESLSQPALRMKRGRWRMTAVIQAWMVIA